MKTHNDLIQGSPQWHAHRARHWNASDCPAMLGCSPYETRQQLLHRMHTGITPEVDAGTQRRFDDGHRFEALARGRQALRDLVAIPQLGLEVRVPDVVDHQVALGERREALGDVRVEGVGAVVGEVGLDSLTSAAGTESALTAAGFRPAWVDLTTTDVLHAGLHVVRVVVPGCLTNAAAGLPFLGSPRLVDSLAGRSARTIPLPH